MLKYQDNKLKMTNSTMIKNLQICALVIASVIFSQSLWANDNNSVNTIELLEQQLASNKGDVIYVDFWASWCIPCRQSFPWMNNLKAKYQADGLTIISVNLDHSRTLANEFLAEIPADFPVIFDPKGLIARKYKLKGMPSSFVVDRTGQIISVHVGFNQQKKIAYEEEIKTLLQL